MKPVLFASRARSFLQLTPSCSILNGMRYTKSLRSMSSGPKRRYWEHEVYPPLGENVTDLPEEFDFNNVDVEFPTGGKFATRREQMAAAARLKDRVREMKAHEDPEQTPEYRAYWREYLESDSLFPPLQLPKLKDVPAENIINVTFQGYDGARVTVKGVIGESILDTARRHNIDIPGYCKGRGGQGWDLGEEGAMCDTCHVYIPFEYAEAVGPVQDEEADRMELMHDGNQHSRLGCCIKLNAACEGMLIAMPRYKENKF